MKCPQPYAPWWNVPSHLRPSEMAQPSAPTEFCLPSAPRWNIPAICLVVKCPQRSAPGYSFLSYLPARKIPSAICSLSRCSKLSAPRWNGPSHLPQMKFGMSKMHGKFISRSPMMQKSIRTVNSGEVSCKQTYLELHKTWLSKSLHCGTKVASRVSNAVRKNEYVDKHVKEDCEQRRCAYCHQRTRIQYKNCQVPLHLKCWYNFHAA